MSVPGAAGLITAEVMKSLADGDGVLDHGTTIENPEDVMTMYALHQDEARS